MGAQLASRPRSHRLPGLCRHRRRRSTSTAWCASTTCASASETGDLQVNLKPKDARQRRRATTSRRRCGPGWRRSRSAGREGQGRRSAAGPAGARAPSSPRSTAPTRPAATAWPSACAKAFAATPRHRRHRRLGGGRRAAHPAEGGPGEVPRSLGVALRDVVETMRMGALGRRRHAAARRRVEVRGAGARHAARRAARRSWPNS